MDVHWMCVCVYIYIYIFIYLFIYIYTYNELISSIHLCFCILPCTLVIVCEDVVKMLPVPSSCAGDTTDTSDGPKAHQMLGVMDHHVCSQTVQTLSHVRDGNVQNGPTFYCGTPWIKPSAVCTVCTFIQRCDSQIPSGV